MSIRGKLAGLAANTVDFAGRVAAVTADGTVAFVKHPATKWAARTTAKGVLVGGSTAAGGSAVRAYWGSHRSQHRWHGCGRGWWRASPGSGVTGRTSRWCDSTLLIDL